MAPIWDRSPTPQMHMPLLARSDAPTRENLDIEGGFLEAWAQGYNVGSLIILILIVFCNYRSGILLHKLILLELVLALWHGTFIFFSDPAYGWYLSSTATLLFISYQVHNVVAWLKIRPFLPQWGSRLFIYSLLAVQPFWIAEAWSNFEYFNSLGSDVNIRMRPYEALLRDPWWIFTTWKLVNAIKTTYGLELRTLLSLNSRFGVMLACMCISIAFLLTDVVVSVAHLTTSSGINPYWRFALVFKCASDTIFLDDFKAVLDAIVSRKASSAGRNNSRSGTQNRGRISLGEVEAAVARQEPVRKARRNFSWRFLNPFRAVSVEEMPRVKQEKIDAANEAPTDRHDSWHSERDLLRTPETAVFGPAREVVISRELDLPTHRCEGTGVDRLV